MAGQQATDPNTDYMTFGPTLNEVSTDYQVRDGAHTIIFANKVSPDMLLVHQSKLVGFYVKLDSSDTVDPTPRAVKDLILRDTSITI